MADKRNLARSRWRRIEETVQNLAAAKTSDFKTLLQIAGYEDGKLIGTRWREISFKDQDLRGLDFSNATFIDCDFKDALISGAEFSGSNVSDQALRRAADFQEYAAVRARQNSASKTTDKSARLPSGLAAFAAKKAPTDLRSSEPKKADEINRPERVTDLLVEGGIHPTWKTANQRKNRFYLLNVELVMGDLNIQPTTLYPDFKDVGSRIRTETDWYEQHRFDYGCSHVFLYPQRRHDRMRFEAAVAIAFVLGEIARDVRPDYDVYERLRIIPAQYFIDGFVADRRDQLNRFYERLSAIEKRKLFGETAPESFDEALLASIWQRASSDLVKQLAHGHTVTWYVADRLRNLINTKFPEEFHVGPVLSAGQTSMDGKPRTRNAVATLAVPLHRSYHELAPLPLATEQEDLPARVLAELDPTEPMLRSGTVTTLKKY